MTTIVFLLEEPSAREMLKGLLPNVIQGDWRAEYIVFQGKQDMDKKVMRRVRGWQDRESLFVVLRDQDSADCHDVKESLREQCRRAGRPDALVRVACRELESFYLGDLAAVEKGLGLKKLAAKQEKARYRSPDEKIDGPSRELIRLTGGKYRKVRGSRAIGPFLAVDGKNKSRSFNELVNGIRGMLGQ